MPELGRYALMLALLLAVYAVSVGLWANRTGDSRWRESVRGAAVALTLAMTTAVMTLEYLLVTGDYAVQAVYNHSDRALPLLYKLGALWGGDSGSVLFWGWILSLYTGYVAWRGWPREGRMTPLVVPFLALLLVFFTGMSNVVVDPFRLVPGHPTNGNGLDPLLQNWVMTIHPPAMYTGLIGMAVPAAYILAAVWQRVPWREWVPVVRRWMLFSWMFLSAALVLGGMWAYMELGWGGYWEWDPVENAALLPWLTATAFLHALQLEEKRGMFRWWTALLGVGTFLLTLIGTYITRSGVLKNSVHSFTGTGVGPYFVGLFWAVLGITVILFWLRREMFQDRMGLDGSFSKEGVYLFINVFFTAIAAVVLVGTFYPVISKAFWGQTIVLNESFFNAMTAPMFLVLVLLLGMAPVMGWRFAKPASVMQKLRVPWGIGLVTMVVVYFHGYRAPLHFIGVGLAAFALASMVQEFYRAARVQRLAHHYSWLVAFLRAVKGNRRRYGGYLAHIAFLIIVLGVIGSHTNTLSVTETLRPGQIVTMRGYTIQYHGLQNVVHPGYETTEALLSVAHGTVRQTAAPGLSFFPGSAQPVAGVYIQGGLMRDLYIVLEGSPGQNQALLQIMVNPMVSWIWIGMYILLAGTLIALSAPAGRDAAPVRQWEIEPLEAWRRSQPVAAGEGGKSP